MITVSDITIGSYVTFTTISSSILGSGYQRARIMAILDADTANAFIPAAQLHAAVYPSMPPSVIDDYTSYLYLKIRTSSGQDTAIGIPWIEESSFVVNDQSRVVVTFASLKPSDVNNVKLALSAVGIKNFTIETQ